MKRTQEEAEKTKQTILDAALTIFSQVGYDNARLNDIAQQADVTRGAIYHHFDNKAGLFTALIEDASKIGNKAVNEAIEEGGSFIDIMTRILVYGMRLLETDQRFREVITLTLFKTGGSPDLEDYRTQRQVETEALIDNIANFFQMGLDSGEIRSDIDAKIAARAFLAYQNGLNLLWISNPSAFSITANSEQFAAVFVHGLKS